MATNPTTTPASGLKVAHDFYRLRREGIGHIQKAGSAEWTDYNTHDPGISILEALAYAITDLAYRTDFPIADILASATTGATPDDPYPGQAFFTARTILTVNPTTAEDLRRLLIDADPVRNAWVRCKACACDAPVFAWCENGEPVLSHDPRLRTDPSAKVSRIEPRGLYDVLLELEADPTFGDLNDRKIVRRRTLAGAGGRRRAVTVEIRFPAWRLAQRDGRMRLARGLTPTKVAVTGPHRTRSGTTPVDDRTLRDHWSDVFYVDLEIEMDDKTTVRIENASMRLFGDSTVRREVTIAQLLAWLGDASEEGFVEPYLRKLAIADRAVDTARAVLESHRNLDEDWCHVDLVEVVEIGVCADVEVEPTADIELVQARVWFEIERYLDPPVAFWSLDALLTAGEPVEAIFNGPELTNGFLTRQELHDSDLRREVRASDILDRLVDIDGVVSVQNLLLTAYDADGNPTKGIADPRWAVAAQDAHADRTSASWLLLLPSDHRPRLHRRLSRFSFTADGLPFVPRSDEAEDTLVQLHGQAARPKIRAADLDVPVPVGRSREMKSYHPVQHSFPLAYGIGPAGLASTAGERRRAQARQLKAYLLVYEQLLRNAYAQVAHAGDLFSLDPTIEHTYFSAPFDGSEIAGYAELVTGLSGEKLARLVESETEFLERRNRFLDHLLARFGEYAMMLVDLEGERAARQDLIRDKIAFLRALPRLGHDRGKAFNRAIAPCDPDNRSGLHQRVNLMLGLPDLTFAYRAWKSADPAGFEHCLSLDEHDRRVMSFTPPQGVETAVADLVLERHLDTWAGDWRIDSTDGQVRLITTDTKRRVAVEELLGSGTGGEAGAFGDVLVAAQRAILSGLVLIDRYRVAWSGNRWKVNAVDGAGYGIGTSDLGFANKGAAQAFIARLATWSAHKRAIVVEHLLLRPKFPGDALYPACTDGDGCGCDEADPYSFRLTYVMPGWTAPFSTNIAMRRFADRMIEEQTPSHLVIKTCWVGNDGYIPDECEPIIDALAAVLADRTTSLTDACRCAVEIFDAYGAVFEAWLAANPLVDDPLEVLKTTLSRVFGGDAVDLEGVSCAGVIDDPVRAELQALLVEHFAGIARHGYQFERFEEAWCRWADADARIDWAGERLQDTVREILASGATTSGVSHEAVCTRAAAVLAGYGTGFREWMEGEIAAGHSLEHLDDFDAPEITLGDDYGRGAAAAIGDLLQERYGAYKEVSYHLHKLLRALGELRNTYPPATLHDCDAGSDFNPVRLGQTALGST